MQMVAIGVPFTSNPSGIGKTTTAKPFNITGVAVQTVATGFKAFSIAVISGTVTVSTNLGTQILDSSGAASWSLPVLNEGYSGAITLMGGSTTTKYIYTEVR